MRMHRLCRTMAVLFICHSQLAGAACSSEIKNAAKVSERIASEWPLRSSQAIETQYVQKIVEYLIPVIKLHMGSRHFNWPSGGKWEFLLTRDLSINAYSIGNGKVYITDGTYNFVETEAELAAIIAHEMAHQLIGHFCQNDKGHAHHAVGSFIQVLNNAKEIEADSLAIEILQYTDFPPQAMLTVVERLPVPEEGAVQKNLRIEALRRLLKDVKVIPFVSSPEFLRIKQDLDIGQIFK